MQRRRIFVIPVTHYSVSPVMAAGLAGVKILSEVKSFCIIACYPASGFRPNAPICPPDSPRAAAQYDNELGVSYTITTREYCTAGLHGVFPG